MTWSVGDGCHVRYKKSEKVSWLPHFWIIFSNFLCAKLTFLVKCTKKFTSIQNIY